MNDDKNNKNVKVEMLKYKLRNALSITEAEIEFMLRNQEHFKNLRFVKTRRGRI